MNRLTITDPKTGIVIELEISGSPPQIKMVKVIKPKRRKGKRS